MRQPPTANQRCRRRLHSWSCRIAKRQQFESTAKSADFPWRDLWKSLVCPPEWCGMRQWDRMREKGPASRICFAVAEHTAPERCAAGRFLLLQLLHDREPYVRPKWMTRQVHRIPPRNHGAGGESRQSGIGHHADRPTTDMCERASCRSCTRWNVELDLRNIKTTLEMECSVASSQLTAAFVAPLVSQLQRHLGIDPEETASLSHQHGI
jgi:hypothetical protein